MKLRYIILVAVFFSAVIVMNAQNPYHLMLDTLYSHSITTITPEKLQRDYKDYLILDTRSKREYEVSHLPNARFVDYDSVSDKELKSLISNRPVLVYCTVGYRSEKVAERLKALGATQVKNLYGGIFEWAHSGFPVVDLRGKNTTRIHTYNKAWSVWLNSGIKVYE